jgi:tRNA pseudouridine32 synthase / 23S rRNA pseudouridine746 synthase
VADPAPILYEDDALFVVDKPSGVAVIPARGEDPSACLKARFEAARGVAPFVVHRLDRGTSGVLVFAKTARAHRALCGLFERRAVQKRYVAILRGDLGVDAGVIDAPLVEGGDGLARVAAVGLPRAKPASTAFVALDRARRADGSVLATLVSFSPTTGRRHQLRAHAASLRCPILGDPLYGDAESAAAAPRLMLHATEIVLPKSHATARAHARSEPPPSFGFVFESLRGR